MEVYVMGNISKYNETATINTLTSIYIDLCNNIGHMKIAQIIAEKYKSKVYVYIQDTNLYKLFVKIDKNVYFCISSACCYDINDNFMEHDPHVYEWTEYRKNYPGKALVVEDRLE